jgi:hypothetical protein
MRAHISISIVKMPELIVMHSLCLSSTRKQTRSSPPLGFDFRALKPVGDLRMSLSTDLEDITDLAPYEEQQLKTLVHAKYRAFFNRSRKLGRA